VLLTVAFQAPKSWAVSYIGLRSRPMEIDAPGS